MKIIPSIFFNRAIHFSFVIQVKYFYLYCCCIMTLSDFFIGLYIEYFMALLWLMLQIVLLWAIQGYFDTFGYVQIIILLLKNFIIYLFCAVFSKQVLDKTFWKCSISQANINCDEGINILLSTSFVRIKQRYTIMENNRQSKTCVSLYSFCISQICHNPIMYAHNNIRD